MRAGWLRHSIDIEESTDTTDNMGGFTKTWAAITNGSGVRAAIWPVRAKELLEAGKLELSTTHKIRIRYISGVNAAMRIKFNDPDGARYFNIRSKICPCERGIMLEFLAEEEV